MNWRKQYGVVRASGEPAWSTDNLPAAMLLRRVNPITLLVVAAIPVLLACWAVFSPAVVLSTEMTWDLLFNLSGAWHLRWGHVPHVDFHGPVGLLNFVLTNLGFDIVGPSPRALLVNIAIVTAVYFLVAWFTALRRLPLLPALLFVLFICLMVLRPANVGDLPSAFSFAMSYNRYGWSGIALVALVLFVPPRPGKAADLVEMGIVAALLAVLFYLKVTYYAVGIGSVATALAVSSHVQARWRGWAVVLLFGGALAVAPFNYSYLADLFAAARAGSIRSFYFYDFTEYFAQYAPYVAAIGIAAWLWMRGQAPLRVPVACAFLLGAGLALLSQNSQAHGVPLAIVGAFLLYETLASDLSVRDGTKMVLMCALLVFPLASIIAAAMSVGGYHTRSTMGAVLHVVDTTNLRGLAVPIEPDSLPMAVGKGLDGHHLANAARALRPRYDLAPYEYVETLEEAAGLLRDHAIASGKIAVLDQVNPFPFMLGLEPPRGGNLWSGVGEPAQSAEDYFKDVDRVLIPKFPTSVAWTRRAEALYGPYLDATFTQRLESQSWIVLSRQAILQLSN